LTLYGFSARCDRPQVIQNFRTIRRADNHPI
jgi:hypothetical protein